MPRRNRKHVELPEIKLPGVEKVTRKLPRLRPENWSRFGRQLLVVIVVGVLVLVMLNLNSRLGEYYRLSAERDRLGTVVAELRVTQQVLETQMAYALSDQAAEDFARNAHMVREGEKLVVPLTPEGNPTPTPQVTQVAQKQLLNWEVWWALFFED